jgi:hypothetical protein
MHITNAQSLRRAFERNLPTILSGVAVVGVIGTVVLAVKATPKAVKEIKSAKEDVYDPEEPLVVGDARVEENYANWSLFKSAKVCWRCYIPTALTGTATIACILGANAIGLRRNAALLAAYTLADTSFREYKDKVVEHITAQKAQKIDDEIMADKIKKNPPPANTTYVFDGGDQLCYESLTGRYFKSSAEKIKRAAQDLDARILQGDLYASLNEFFQELGLDSTQLGELLGFTIECRIKVVFSVHLNECDQPCLAVGYEKLPVYNYDKL